MTSIIGFTQLLNTHELDDEKKKKYLNYIEQSGESLLNLIDDIIYIAKIESGVINIAPKNFNLTLFLNEMENIFKLSIEKSPRKKDIKLIFEHGITDGEVYIHSDAERIKQIITNLFTNALKFTSKGHIKIGYKNQNNKWLKFYVEDTGIGIPEDKLQVIFERFMQVEDEKGYNKNGTGLGLAISKNLTQLLGGEIYAESELEKGTTFFFTIPFTKTVEEKEEKEDEVDSDNSEITFNGIKNILIADDEEKNFVLIKEIFDRENINVFYAQNGLDALEYFEKKERIHLVLMDIKMNKMDGIEAFNRIKKIDSKVPVIAQTAYAMEEEEKRLSDIGFDDYIKKPIEIKSLFNKVVSWLNKN